MPDSLHRNRNLAFNLVLIVIGMLMLTAASVPLYRLFCQVTGYGGTVTQSFTAPEGIIAREFTVRFNADIDPNLPWEFAPMQKSIRVKAGEQMLVHYMAHNKTNRPVMGRAVYNVVPFAAGSFFQKIQCFCFEEQTLAPGERVEMPVLFYIDPDVVNDSDMKDVQTITLSYTFFPVKTDTTLLPKKSANTD